MPALEESGPAPGSRGSQLSPDLPSDPSCSRQWGETVLTPPTCHPDKPLSATAENPINVQFQSQYPEPDPQLLPALLPSWGKKTGLCSAAIYSAE